MKTLLIIVLMLPGMAFAKKIDFHSMIVDGMDQQKAKHRVIQDSVVDPEALNVRPKIDRDIRYIEAEAVTVIAPSKDIDFASADEEADLFRASRIESGDEFGSELGEIESAELGDDLDF